MKPIDGATVLLAIIADPVAQAQTPKLLNAALERREQNAALVPMHVPGPALRTVVEGLRRIENFAGAVVSMPHKRPIVELLDGVTSFARDVGACNVIRRDAAGALEGTMLDGRGFVDGLRHTGIAVAGKRVFVCGAGGAAAGIAFALAADGVRALTVHNRTRETAAALAARLHASFTGIEIAVDIRPAGHDLIVNATSLGMGAGDALPIAVDAIDEGAIVAEAIVAPDETRLLIEAQARGLRTHRGRFMLEAQIEPMIDFMLGSASRSAEGSDRASHAGRHTLGVTRWASHAPLRNS